MGEEMFLLQHYSHVYSDEAYLVPTNQILRLYYQLCAIGVHKLVLPKLQDVLLSGFESNSILRVKQIRNFFIPSPSEEGSRTYLRNVVISYIKKQEDVRFEVLRTILQKI
jgi:hypothetical protein